MSDARLERYLEDLFGALAPLSLSERSEIVTEIKSHIQSKRQAAPERPLEDILAEVGEPATLAAVYREERGVTSEKHAERTRPETKEDEEDADQVVDPAKLAQDILAKMVQVENDRVKLFGGLIDIDGKQGKVKIGDKFTFDGKSHMDAAARSFGKSNYRGKYDIADGETRTIRLRWNVGTVDIVVHDSNELSWKWKGLGTADREVLSTDGDAIELDLTAYGPGKGTVFVPNRVPLAIAAEVGKIHIHNPAKDTDISLSVGKVEILKHPLREYRWNLKAAMGKAPVMESSEDPEAPLISAVVNTGKIEVEDSDYCS